jgi:hypothetical protein
MSSAHIGISQPQRPRLVRIVCFGALWGGVFGAGLLALYLSIAHAAIPERLSVTGYLVPLPFVYGLDRFVRNSLSLFSHEAVTTLACLMAGLLAARAARSVWAGALAGFVASLLFDFVLLFALIFVGNPWPLIAHYLIISVFCAGVGALGGLIGHGLVRGRCG